MAWSRLKILLCVAISLTFLVAPFALDIIPDGKAYAGGKKSHNRSHNLPAPISKEEKGKLLQTQYHKIEGGEQGGEQRETHSVPEPTTMLLVGAGLAGLVITRKKFKK